MRNGVRETRLLPAILGGAFERPRIVEELELALGELAIEWIRVPDESPTGFRKLVAEGPFPWAEAARRREE